MQNQTTIYAPAKLNLFLHVTGQLPEGYHNLETFVVFLDLQDKIEVIALAPQKSLTANAIEPQISSSPKDFTPIVHSLTITGPMAKYLTAIPQSLSVKSTNTSTSTTRSAKPNVERASSSNNIILAALNFAATKYGFNQVLSIKLTKNIPVGAGLGGGSADCAAILKYASSLCSKRPSLTELATAALELGADVPMCLYNQSGLASRLGENMSPINLNFPLHVLLVNPGQTLSTQAVFKKLSSKSYQPALSPHTISKLKQAAQSSFTDFISAIKPYGNSLSAPACQLAPAIQPILTALNNTNAAFTNLSGSGATCFALYSSQKHLMAARAKLKSLFPTYAVIPATTLQP